MSTDIARWIDDHGYELVETYRLHGKSASKGKQDAELDRVIADMKSGKIKVLVVWQSSRIERRGAYSVFDLARRVREAGGRIEYVQDAALNQTNELSDVLLALYATKDRQKSQDISKQVLASFATSKKNNSAIGRPGYGYRVVGDAKYEKRFVIESVEAAVIREAKDRYLGGETIDAICDDFNARHIASPMWKGQPGKHWHAKTLAGLLRSPSIAGRRVDKSGKTVAKYEGIITWDEHKRLVARLDSRAHRKGVSPGNVALLTGILFDANGHGMYPIKGWGKRPTYYCRKPGCHASVDLAEMDARVSKLFARNTTPYMIDVLVPGENHADEIERLRQDRAELDDLADDYDDRHAELTAEIRRLVTLDRENPNPDRTEQIDSGKTYGEVWQAMTTAERRDMMLDTGFRVIWRGDGKWSVLPGDMTVDFAATA